MTVHLFEILGPVLLICGLIRMGQHLKATMNRGEIIAATVTLLLVAAVFVALFCWGLHRLHQQENSWQPYNCPHYQCDLPLLGPK